MKNQIKTIFKERFNYASEKTYFSPGRVNIIGGHTDYNGGAVLPFCIDLGITAAVAKRNDGIIRVYSHNLPKQGIVTIDLKDLAYDNSRGFANYVSGVCQELKLRQFPINHGFDLVMYGNLPRGGGLSSSAALLILICKIISDQENLGLDGIQMALISKTVENIYIGVSCGIMDQFIIANGLDKKAIFLQSNTLDYDYVPVDTTHYKLVLINSQQTRKLTESNYNTRQLETQDALHILKKYTSIEYLCDLSIETFEALKHHLNDDILEKRVRHVVYENERVKQAKKALEKSNFERLGTLLCEAHVSARDLYEISSDKLNHLVDMALDLGSVGSKMIGGGFGGSTLNIIKAEALDDFIEQFSVLYQFHYHMEPIIQVVEPTRGVHILR